MAVYTRLTRDEIEAHLKNYAIGELKDFKEIIAGIDNSNFILKTKDDQKYILTIFEKRIKPTDLPFFISLKLHLADHGILCPRPILDNNGASLVDLKDKKSAIVTFLSGSVLEPRKNGLYDNITVKHCSEIGTLLARLHIAAKGFLTKRENDLGVDKFEGMLGRIKDQIGGYKEDLYEEISSNITILKENWKVDLPSCPAHLDLFPDNVFFDSSGVLSGVIDFYFGANDLEIFDFAIAANAWCFDENNQFIPQRLDAMLKSYEKTKPFSKEEKDFLKIALLGASMRFLLTRLNDMFFTPEDSLVNIKDPQEYLVKMQYFKNQL